MTDSNCGLPPVVSLAAWTKSRSLKWFSLYRQFKREQCLKTGLDRMLSREPKAPPMRLILFLIAAFCRPTNR